MIGKLFAGRLTIDDTLRLAEALSSGWLQPPVYVPAWASDLRRLAAMMACSAFVSQVNLSEVSLQSFLELEQSIQEESA